jgi:hypothetical protein
MHPRAIHIPGRLQLGELNRAVSPHALRRNTIGMYSVSRQRGDGMAAPTHDPSRFRLTGSGVTTVPTHAAVPRVVGATIAAAPPWLDGVEDALPALLTYPLEYDSLRELVAAAVGAEAPSDVWSNGAKAAAVHLLRARLDSEDAEKRPCLYIDEHDMIMATVPEELFLREFLDIKVSDSIDAVGALRFLGTWGPIAAPEFIYSPYESIRAIPYRYDSLADQVIFDPEAPRLIFDRPDSFGNNHRSELYFLIAAASSRDEDDEFYVGGAQTPASTGR